MSNVGAIWDRIRAAWPPPPRITVSEWADEHGIIPAGESGTAGTARWRTRAFQRAILDAFPNPAVRRVRVIKSARVGWTAIIRMVIGYYVHHEPRSILAVQPTEGDAKEWSKDVLDPMIEETPVLAPLFGDPELRSESTILQKFFRGGLCLRLKGAQTGTGFRRFAAGLALLDEVDGYPLVAGADGDQIKLAEKRTETIFDAVVGIGSTPLLDGFSRIQKLTAGPGLADYILRCPHCGERHVRRFREPEEPLVLRGWKVPISVLVWDDGEPTTARYVCPAGCGKSITHAHHALMIEGGEWLAETWSWTREGGFVFEAAFDGTVAFRLWAGLNSTPASTPAEIAREWLEVKDDPEARQVFVNTVLGEPYVEQGEQPHAYALSQRCEPYGELDCPAAVDFLTAFVDIQADRFELEVAGWKRETRESWSVDYLILPGGPDDPECWLDLQEALETVYTTPEGPRHVDAVGIDTGYRQDEVMEYIRKHGGGRTLPMKGIEGKRPVVESLADRLQRLRALRHRGDRVRPVLVGVDTGKLAVYRALQVTDAGPRFCHFPVGREPAYFEGLTAEKRMIRYRKGHAHAEWHKIRERNEPLDCRVGNLALCLLMEQKVIPRRPPPGSPTRTARPAPAAARSPRVGLGREGWNIGGRR